MYLVSILKDWQTLLAGVIAIGAAFIGGQYINKQIQSDRDIAADERRRKFAAARAALPLVLSALSDYAIEASAALTTLLATKKDEIIPRDKSLGAFPTFAPTVVSDLREIIEFSDEPITNNLVEILSVLQIQRARLNWLYNNLKSESDTIVMAANVENYIVQTAEIYARCANLFDFARGKLVLLPATVTSGNVHSALNQAGLWGDKFPRLHETVDRAYPGELK